MAAIASVQFAAVSEMEAERMWSPAQLRAEVSILLENHFIRRRQVKPGFYDGAQLRVRLNYADKSDSAWFKFFHQWKVTYSITREPGTQLYRRDQCDAVLNVPS